MTNEEEKIMAELEDIANAIHKDICKKARDVLLTVTEWAGVEAPQKTIQRFEEEVLEILRRGEIPYNKLFKFHYDSIRGIFDEYFGGVIRTAFSWIGDPEKRAYLRGVLWIWREDTLRICINNFYNEHVRLLLTDESNTGKGKLLGEK